MRRSAIAQLEDPLISEATLRFRFYGHSLELMSPEEIEHRTTQVRRPQSNGLVERLHRTLIDAHFRIVGRTRFYETIDKIQIELDDYLEVCNQEWAQQGRNMSGRTPYKAFIEGIIHNEKRRHSRSVDRHHPRATCEVITHLVHVVLASLRNVS